MRSKIIQFLVRLRASIGYSYFLTAGLQFVVNRNAMYGMVGGILGGFLSSMALGAPRIGKINPLNRVVSGLIYVITLILFVYLGMNR